MVLDEVARRHGGSWRSKFSGSLAEVRLGDLRLVLLKPETYMNESGRSVAAAARYFKVEPESLLVVHDDVDLEPGRLQARLGGGLAGHNGLRSLARDLGTQEFLPPRRRSARLFVFSTAPSVPHSERTPARRWSSFSHASGWSPK